MSEKTKEFLQKIRDKGIWNENYDYSQIEYINTKTPVIIVDKKMNTKHLISPNKLLTVNRGCNIQNAVDSTEYFIKKSKLIHGDKFDYSNSKYVDGKTEIKIKCKEHDFFTTLPSAHYRGFGGCKKCTPLNRKKSREELIRGFLKVHGDKYDYSLITEDFIGAKDYIKIICPIHNEFTQRAGNHLDGRGCRTCGSGWNTERIINYINDIANKDILSMDPVELNMLIAQGKLPSEFEELVFKLEGTGENSLKSLKEKLGLEEREYSDEELSQLGVTLDEMTSESQEEMADAIEAISQPQLEELELESEIELKKRKNLPNISNADILVLDKELINTCDDEAVEFFIQYKLRKVWNEILNDKRNAKDIKALNGGKNSSRLRDLFLEEYNDVFSYKPPKGYSFKVGGNIAPPNMMQKLTVNRLKKYKRYGNWSGTGAGKTISFIVASREVDSRLTLVICLNSTVTQLEEDILEVYPDSKVYNRFRKGQKFDRNNFNYLLLNYEKFQQGYTEEMFQDLNENNQVDFIVIDEVHNAKQRGKEESLRRGSLMRLIGRSAEQNLNLHLLGMSATPVINNLIEAKSLLQMITGKKYSDIQTRGTINNALKIFNQLLLNGVRYIPKYEIILKELTALNSKDLDIDGSEYLEDLKENGNKDYLGLEKILIKSKMQAVKKYLKPKTILYTYFTDNDRIPKSLSKQVKSLGFSYSMYVGSQTTEEREYNKKQFIAGNSDILIASRIVGTGVDGLQKVANRMIILTLPWTDSEYTQLKGRIYRQGSNFGDVEIIIPQVHVSLDNGIRWSWDKQRLQLIRDKRTLADAAVDGIIPSKHLPTKEKLCSDSLKALRDWKKRVNEGKVLLVDRMDLVLPLRPEIVEYLRPTLGDFSELNKKWSTSRSKSTFERLKSNPGEWYYYHTEYAKKRETWDEIPYMEIAKKLKGRPDWIVADMGCGENLLSKEIKNKVHAFDYISHENEKDVIACDMCNVPLREETVDAAVFSLSLMGSNYVDYFKEAYRIMKPYGNMFIAEPKKKLSKRLDKVKKELEDIGFRVVDVNSDSTNFIYIDAIKQIT